MVLDDKQFDNCTARLLILTKNHADTLIFLELPHVNSLVNFQSVLGWPNNQPTNYSVISI